MPYTEKTTPKVREVKKVKDVLLKEVPTVKVKKLHFAVGSGSIPPEDNNTNVYNRLSPEKVQSIMKIIGDNNKIFLISIYK